MIKYYELRFRTLKFEGKGDPAGFDEVTYIRSEDRNEVFDYVKRYGVELINSNDLFAEGFYIAELAPVRLFDTEALELKINEENRKKQEYEKRKNLRHSLLDSLDSDDDFDFFKGLFW